MAMQGLKTLADLRTLVRLRAEMPSPNRPTDAQLNLLINEKAKRLYALVALRDPSTYAKTSANLDLTSGTVAFGTSLPDFFKLLRVDALVSGQWRRVERFSLKMPESTLGPVGWMRYQLRGSTLYATPSPPQYPTWRLIYIPRLADLVQDTDTLDGVNGWEELLALEAAIALKTRDEEDASQLMRERDQLRKDLESEVDDQDAGEPYVVDDVRDGWEWW